jgi:multidrug efflux pump subunit AcrA (membrane-fusion protein)
LVIAGLVVASLAGCSSLSGTLGRSSVERDATPTPIPTAVIPEKPTYQVQRGTVVEEIRFTGRLSSVREETLFFKMDGRVGTVSVRQGAKAKQGETLATLEVSDLRNQLAQAELNLQQAQTRRQRAEEAVNEQQAELQVPLEIARLRLAQARAQDPTADLAIAKANLEKAQAAVEQAQAAYDRRRGDPGIGASQESLNLQRATLDYEIAKAQYTQVMQAARSREYDLKILEQNVRLAELNQQKAQTEIDPTLEQEVAKSQLALERLKAQLANAQLVASIDGDVIMVGIKPGDNTPAYRAAIIIAAPGDLEIRANLTAAEMGRLSVGQPCAITPISQPTKSFHGRVRRMPYPYGTGGGSELAGASDDQSTRVTIDDSDGSLARGDLVNVTATLQRKEDVLWLPPGAFRTFQGRTFVVVMTADGQQRTPVRIGIRGDERWEILSGTLEGQMVIGP